jgi:hypothetical protein
MRSTSHNRYDALDLPRGSAFAAAARKLRREESAK